MADALIIVLKTTKLNIIFVNKCKCYKIIQNKAREY